MTLHTFKGFVDGARDAYLHAVEKHPQFTDKATSSKLGKIRIMLEGRRGLNDTCVKYNMTPTFENIISEELLEYYEASILGDAEAAKREPLDCVAVLMREWERISQ